MGLPLPDLIRFVLSSSPILCYSPPTGTASGLGLPLPQNSLYSHFFSTVTLSQPQGCCWHGQEGVFGKRGWEAADGARAVETADLTRAGLLTHWVFCSLRLQSGMLFGTGESVMGWSEFTVVLEGNSGTPSVK